MPGYPTTINRQAINHLHPWRQQTLFAQKVPRSCAYQPGEFRRQSMRAFLCLGRVAQKHACHLQRSLHQTSWLRDAWICPTRSFRLQIRFVYGIIFHNEANAFFVVHCNALHALASSVKQKYCVQYDSCSSSPSTPHEEKVVQ